jgi:hypothetical protein
MVPIPIPVGNTLSCSAFPSLSNDWRAKNKNHGELSVVSELGFLYWNLSTLIYRYTYIDAHSIFPEFIAKWRLHNNWFSTTRAFFRGDSIFNRLYSDVRTEPPLEMHFQPPLQMPLFVELALLPAIFTNWFLEAAGNRVASKNFK